MIEGLKHSRSKRVINGKSFELRSLSAGEISTMLKLSEGIEQQCQFLSLCAVEPTLTPAEAECLPFPMFTELVQVAMKLNGLDAEGE